MKLLKRRDFGVEANVKIRRRISQTIEDVNVRERLLDIATEVDIIEKNLRDLDKVRPLIFDTLDRLLETRELSKKEDFPKDLQAWLKVWTTRLLAFAKYGKFDNLRKAA